MSRRRSDYPEAKHQSCACRCADPWHRRARRRLSGKSRSPPPSAPDHTKKEGGIYVFGYTFLPKLAFGLDLLYGEGQQQLNLNQGLTTFDADSDVTVFGKAKRRF